MIEYWDELPSDILNELYEMLDKDGVWKELGEQMQYKKNKIDKIAHRANVIGNSPSKALFNDWTRYHHYTVELNALLFRMEHIPAMRCLKQFVDASYHFLLEDLLVRAHKPGYKVKYSDDGSLKDRPTNIHDDVAKASSIPKINYFELTEATGDWNEQHMIGRGGFAKVYKAKWKNFSVAVKRLNATDSKKSLKELIKEIGLDGYRHDNIIPLYGYSIEDGGSHVCLVYQLMAGGSLDKRIRNTKNDPNFKALTWPQRYEIALGVARGLQYLHNKDNYLSLIHTDIKPGNILLDEYLRPKIGDFGLSKVGFFGDTSQLVVSNTNGTWPYMPPEYLYGKQLTRGLDTYSFGVVVLELATGRSPYRHMDINGEKKPLRLPVEISHDIKIFDKVSLEDKALIGTPKSNPTLFLIMLSIGLLCTSEQRKQRPTMVDVYTRLDDIPRNVIRPE